MVFNPLFLQVVNNQEAPLLNKTQKLTGPSYLFSDIIKVHLDKNETASMPQDGDAAADKNLLSSIISALSGNDTQSQVKNAAGLNSALDLKSGQLNRSGAIDLLNKDLSDGSETSGDLNSLLVGNSELVNFINSLLTNQQFNGKITIVEPESDGTLPAGNLNAGQVLNLLKDGGTIAVENSAFQSNNGLLIRLIELDGNTKASSNGNIPSVDALSEMLASQSGTQGDGAAQVSGPMYKLNFSLVNNPEVPETLIDNQKPIIKFPFNSPAGADVNSFKFTPEMSQGNTAAGDLTASVNTAASVTGGNISASDVSVNSDLTAETPVAPPGDEKTEPLSATDTQMSKAEIFAALKKGDLVQEDTLKEIDVKAGKFGKIERVKTDPSIQVKDPAESGLWKRELSASDPQNAESSNAGQKKTQNTDESVNKKTAEDQAQKSADGIISAQKEKDLKLSPAAKQDAQLETAEKTDTKDTAKSDLNSSAKDFKQDQASTEQNHKSQEAVPAGEHSEVKGKPQEDHSFNIGSLLKNNENSFALKRASDGGIFGEAAKTVKAAEVMKEISKFIQQGDRNSIVLKIDPENLGSVKIALDLADKVVHANIEVENEAARKLMENNLNQLYSSLNQNGLQLNSINISLANSEQKQGKMPNQKRRAFAGESDKDTDDIDVLRQKQMGYNTYDYLI